MDTVHPEVAVHDSEPREIATMQRIVILGPPGSGKSTLARRIGARHGLPVFHLDQAFFAPHWVEIPAPAFRAEVERIAALPSWVIDGNYIGTIAPRLATADTVVCLDVPSWISVLRILRRVVGGYGRVRIDSAPGCAERLDLAFVRWTWSWNRVSRARIVGIVETFPSRRVILRTAAERRRFLDEPP